MNEGASSSEDANLKTKKRDFVGYAILAVISVFFFFATWKALSSSFDVSALYRDAKKMFEQTDSVTAKDAWQSERRREKALADYTVAIEMRDAPAQSRSWALFARGKTYKELGERDRAFADFTAVIEMEDPHVYPRCFAKSAIEEIRKTQAESK